MSILKIDLKEKKIEALNDRQESGYRLLKVLSREWEDSIVILSATNESLEIEGSANALFSYNSPLSKKREYAYSALLSPFVLLSFGYSALVITGRSDTLCYISLRGDKIEILDIENGLSYDGFLNSVRLKNDDIVLGTSLAAESGIKIAAAYENSKEIARSFGHAFASLNLKGICFQNYMAKRKESDEGKKYIKELEDSRLAERLKRDSTSVFVKYAERCGALAIENYTRRRDARAIFLDGSYLKEKIGVYSAFCRDCRVQCRRILRDGSSAPDIIDVMALGSLQNIFDASKVLKLKKAVFDKGLDTIEAGAMLANYDESLSDKIKRIENYSGEEYESYKAGGKSILLDPRGMGESALFLSLGDDHLPYFSLYRKKGKKTDERVAATLALYERALRFALTERGLPFLGAVAAYIDRIPTFAYLSPNLFKYFFSRIDFFGIKAKVLLKEGLEIINLLGEDEYPIPDHFLYKSSSTDDLSTVKITRLLNYYEREKKELEIKLLDSKSKGERE